ncbi:MAG: hypothetical protein ACRDJF_10655 [Actinomycetota bacterium]
MRRREALRLLRGTAGAAVLQGEAFAIAAQMGYGGVIQEVRSRRVGMFPALALVVIASMACRGQDPTLTPPPRPASPTPDNSAPLQSLTIQMTGRNGSGQDGNAVLTGEAGKTRVVIDLESSPAGPQPVHIHQGTCANLGPVFRPLTALQNGHSDTSVDVSLVDLVGGTYSINAHRSQTEAKIYVSCGQIKRG